jgi:hypothetical protein
MDIEKAFQKWHEYEMEKLKQHGSFKDLKEIQLEAYTAGYELAQNEIAELKQGQINKDDLCKGCYWVENKPLTPVCDLCRVTKSNYTNYEHSIAETKVEEYNG